MLLSQRVVRYVAFAAAILGSAVATAAPPALVGPMLQTSPVEAGPAPTQLADKRAQNAELLRLAQRKLEINGAADKAAARDVAYYRTREAVLAQQETAEQRI